MKRFLLVSLSVLIMGMTIHYLNSKDPDLVIGTNPVFPPFEYIGGEYGNEIVGFDIELARDIARSCGKSLKVHILEFEDLIPALQNGSIDMVVSALNITSERMDLVDFSIAYYAGSEVVLVRKDDELLQRESISKSSLAENRRIGSMIGSKGFVEAVNILGGDEDLVFTKNSWGQLVDCLLEDHIDTLIITSALARTFASEIDDIAILPIEFDADYYAVAVAKGNDNLMKHVNKAVIELVDTRDYRKIVREYAGQYMRR